MQLSEIQPGTKIKDYQITKYIGSGAMGVVFEARQEYLSQKVAIKFHNPQALAEDPKSLKSFKNEANILIALHHPNVVKGYEINNFHGLHYFAMEFVEGRNLNHILKEYGRIGTVRSLEIALELVEALDYCWNKLHLVHGDIKPENIIVKYDGHIKLMDFGVAQADSFHSIESVGIMTPLYAAPEVINKNTNTRLSDIYSFGATLYHLLAGHPPFPGNDPEQVMSHQLTIAPTPLHECYSDIDEEISLFIHHLLQKSPKNRPQTWQEIRSALYRFCYKYELNDENFSYLDDNKFTTKNTDNRIQPKNQTFAYISANIPWKIINSMVGILVILIILASALTLLNQSKVIRNNYSIIPYPSVEEK